MNKQRALFTLLFGIWLSLAAVFAYFPQHPTHVPSIPVGYHLQIQQASDQAADQYAVNWNSKPSGRR